jgi:hypothetical protein
MTGLKTAEELAEDGNPLESTANSQRRVGRIAQAVSDGFDTAWNLM